MRGNVTCEFPFGYDGTTVLDRLAQVLDPELDERILDLGFVRSFELSSGHASVLRKGFLARQERLCAKRGARRR